MRVSAVFLVVCLGCAAHVPPPRTASAPAPQTAGATILSTALAVAETTGIPRMQGEKNLTWQSTQLTALAQLFAKAGRYDRALQLIHDLDTPDRVKAPAFVPLAVAAIQAHDAARARMILDRLSALDPDWTVPIAFADIATAPEQAGDHAGAARLLDKVDDPVARAKALLAAKEPLAALAIARAIHPASMHIPSDDGAFREDDYSARQSFLLELVGTFVDSGDLLSAHKAMEALNDVPARADFVLGKRTEALALLDRSLQLVERIPVPRPTGGGSTWGGPAPILQNRAVTARSQRAASKRPSPRSPRGAKAGRSG